MAPDLNSVPPSPRPQPLPGTISSSVAPGAPLLSTTLTNVLPSNNGAVVAAGTYMGGGAGSGTGPGNTAGESTGGIGIGAVAGVGPGLGPLRHSRPLTAADLYAQLEKEQEALVNRLTRELTVLRASQNASVVSNSSSTSTGLPDGNDHSTHHLLSGPSHPAPSPRRDHRSSSSTSSRSVAAATLASFVPSTTADRAGGRGGGTGMSRQNSANRHTQGAGTSVPSGAVSPAAGAGASHHGPQPAGSGEAWPNIHQPHPSRPIALQDVIPGSIGGLVTVGGEREVHLTGRYEETAFHRMELDGVKRENELLRRRVRDLEALLSRRRRDGASASVAGASPGAAGSERSESASNTHMDAGRGAEEDAAGGVQLTDRAASNAHQR